MRQAPTFILSLDCEGKWGMADSLQPYHHRLLTSQSLAAAYRRLLDMFERFEVSATFAFVMAFTLSAGERKDFPVLDPRRKGRDPWLLPYWQCLEAGLDEGWHEPRILDMVRKSGRHEIACHGFCHRPLADAAIDAAGARAELDQALAAAALKEVELKTLVFPRNQVGNLPVLSPLGFLGYRSRLNRPAGRAGRMLALAEEFSLFSGPQKAEPAQDGLVAIPPGRFFNWRFGARRLVPPAVTRARWRSQLRRCVSDGGVVHLWLHPHNLATAPATGDVLAEVLAEVARLRDRGLIEIQTQRDFCGRLLGPAA